jgi:DNA repair exonuclease SbcCD ATPase subunit
MTLGYHDAVSIKQHLTEQHEHIQKLRTESAKLDAKLTKTQETKVASQKEVDQLEQQTKDAQAERAKLEAELGAN